METAVIRLDHADFIDDKCKVLSEIDVPVLKNVSRKKSYDDRNGDKVIDGKFSARNVRYRYGKDGKLKFFCIYKIGGHGWQSAYIAPGYRA